MEVLALYKQVEEYARPRMLQNLAQLSPEEFVRELPGIAWGSIRNCLVHIPGAENHWIKRVLQGRVEETLGRPEDYHSVEAVRARWEEVAAETKRFLGTFTAEQLTEIRPYQWRGEAMHLRADFVVLHILTHEFHHKGQLMMALRSLGYGVEETDLL